MKGLAALLVSFVAVGVVATRANAAIVGLTEVSPIEAFPNSTLTVAIEGSRFPNTTIGGEMSVRWDPAVLDFQSFTRDDPPWPNGMLLDDDSDGEISFGVSSNDFDQGPDFPIGTLSYEVIGAVGTSSLIEFSDFGDGWLALEEDDEEDVEEVDVTYVPGAVTVVVPLPAAGWLMLGGLGVLMGALRRPCHHHGMRRAVLNLVMDADIRPPRRFST